MFNLKKQLADVVMKFDSLTKHHIEEYCARIIKLTTDTYDCIAALSLSPEKIRFNTVVQPLIDLEIITSKARALCTFPKFVYGSEEIQEASRLASNQLEELQINMNLRDDVFKVLKHYESHDFANEQSNLDPEEIRYFKQLMKALRREGMAVSEPSIKSEIQALKQKIAERRVAFENNLSHDKAHFSFSAEDLKGLPPDYLSERKQSEGSYKVTLKYPDVFPILEYAKNRDIRKKIYLAFNSRAPKNMAVLTELVRLRSRLASLLGYATHVDFVTENRMMKSAKNLKQFLDTLCEQFSEVCEEDINVLRDFAKSEENDPNFILEYYDLSYYMRKYEEKLLNIDLESVKSYFPSQHLLSSMLNLFSRIFNLTFRQSNTTNKWHSDVVVLEVLEHDQTIGTIYLDLFPREGKFSHGAAFDLIPECDLSHLEKFYPKLMRQYPEVAIVCNLDKPTFSYHDVLVLFHEFGHALHNICAKTKLPKYYAYGVEWDFIEVPSQVLEYWARNPKLIKDLSFHPETKKPLPDDIIEKLLKINKLHMGYSIMRQLSLSYFDYSIHTQTEKLDQFDVNACYLNTQQKLLKLPPLKDTLFPASFGHLASHYDGGYYTYLLNRLYAADIFKSHFEKDPLSSVAMQAYRKGILEPGGSLDAMVLLIKFLGREPNTEAFFQEIYS